ncbi:hypothetical protein DXG01_015714 [Tephrocybe rancida]|nr:hypothetical protein DXG01_015714 [Tephrocybe rancida]
MGPPDAWVQHTATTDAIVNNFYGKTFTQTQQTNATISLDFDGVSLSVFGSTNGTFVASIDGKNYYGTILPSSSAQPAALFGINSLGPGKHTVTITNLDEDGILYIDYKNGTLARAVVDDIEPLFNFQHVDALSLFGTVGPDHGSYSVQLDDQPQQSFRAIQSTPAVQALLYYTSQLEAGNHTLHVVNQDDAVFDVDWINLASVNVTATSPVTDPSSTSGAPTATNSGATGTSRKARKPYFSNPSPTDITLAEDSTLSLTDSTLLGQDGSNISVESRRLAGAKASR